MPKRPRKRKRAHPALTWQDRVGRAVGLIVATSQVPHYLMRTKIIEAARESIDLGVSSEGMIKVCPREVLRPGEPDDKLLSMAGIFRLILVNDVPNYRHAMVAETFMAEVQRRLDAELARI